MPHTAAKPSARERILATASTLFYHHGYQAVGIDTIVAESGVAKMTLYRHFPSKDALIVAYLERSDRLFWVWFEEAVAQAATAEEQLHAVFQALSQQANSPQCLGCPFQGTAAEFPSIDHPGHQVALQHKQSVRQRFAELAAAAGLRQPEQLANQLLLLMDGAWTAARIFGPNNPAMDVTAAAATLIAAQR